MKTIQNVGKGEPNISTKNQCEFRYFGGKAVPAPLVAAVMLLRRSGDNYEHEKDGI